MQVFKEQFLSVLSPNESVNQFVTHFILMPVLSGCIIKLPVVVLRLN